MTERDDNRSWECRFLAGQPEGYAALYRQYGRDVLGILLRLTRGDRAEAEDLAQETFFAAYQGRSAFRPGTSLRAWLLGIAVRRWRDTCRRAGRLVTPPLPRPLRHWASLREHSRQ